ncbi:MAG: hypothetical protein AAF318_05825 [Pseudomonadota bacterium]
MTRSFRLSVLVLSIISLMTAAAAVFINKKEAERDGRAIGELNRKIAAERQRISELRAEWSALDHPARLQVLVERHNDVLGLAPIAAAQIVDVAQIRAAVATHAAEREEGEE